MGVRAVMFDFDHTLGRDNKLEEAVLGQLARLHCGELPDPDAIHAVLHRFRTDHAPLGVALEQGLKSWGCRHPAERLVAEYKARVLELAPTWVVPMPGAQQMLAELDERGVPMAILSNGWTDLQHLKAQIIGFEGPVFASEEIGAWKPDCEAFRIAAARCAWEPAETLYVGDDPLIDVIGAKAAGMRAAWADLEGKPYPPEAPAPDFAVTSLTALPPCIE